MLLLDPRRSGGALWLAWVLAGALGGGLATLLVVEGMNDWLYGGGQLTGLASGMVLAAVAALFQYLVLRFVAAGRRAAVLWLPATVVAYGVYVWLNTIWFGEGPNLATWLSANFRSLDPATTMDVIFTTVQVEYAVAFGICQGIVLALMTRRVASLAIWVGGNLVGLLVSIYLPTTFVSIPAEGGAFLVASSAIQTGKYAFGTGLALAVILRVRPRAAARAGSSPAPGLQSQG